MMLCWCWCCWWWRRRRRRRRRRRDGARKTKRPHGNVGKKRLKPDSSHHNPRWWSGKELKNGEPCRFGNLVDGLSHLNSHYLQCFIVINMFPTGVWFLPSTVSCPMIGYDFLVIFMSHPAKNWELVSHVGNTDSPNCRDLALQWTFVYIIHLPSLGWAFRTKISLKF